MPRSGEIGEQIYDQVEKLVADGMNRTEAFAKISADSGRRAGTVAANYYRVARKRAGGSLRPRSKRGRPARRTAASASSSSTGRRGRARSRSASGDIDSLANALVRDVQALANAIKSQADEVAEMRKKLDGLKKLLD
ncbi:MAG TPA: hypothetical protein VHL51_04990 [Gaiellales bacterium]|jgi:hypothetical protein|nr:hypothetical protein [Gaiellales bacterium]